MPFQKPTQKRRYIFSFLTASGWIIILPTMCVHSWVQSGGGRGAREPRMGKLAVGVERSIVANTWKQDETGNPGKGK